ncbi:MAG: biotin--[acetyl-CoA-carboxylase] ligase [Caldisericaceae bacterium]
MDFFRTVIEIHKCSSTMNFARQATDFVDKPFIVRADIQTKGKGQYERRWSSKAGGLWMTQVFDINNPLGLSTFIAIPLLRTLKKYHKNVNVKWPNDILLENKKIAGILTEIKDKTAFIGIGINIANDIPVELENIATTLSTVAEVSPSAFLGELLRIEEPLLNTFIADGFASFRNEYEDNLVFINRQIIVESKETYSGKAVGVSNAGELIIESNGSMIKISSGTVKEF